MSGTRLAARLSAGDVVFTAWSLLPDALTVEALAATAVDAVTLDMQHGGHHEDSVLRGLAPIIAAGKPGVVRIPVGRFDMASRALDFGADAVIAPMVNSVADARAFAASMKYPPVGQRSWGASFAMARRRKSDAAQWLAAFQEITGRAGAAQATHLDILKRISHPVAWAVLEAQYSPLSCGLGVLVEGNLGLFDIATHTAHQRQGLARHLCRALLAWGSWHNAHTAFLQVEASNSPAIGLYESLGFRAAYRYWYRLPG